MILTLYYIIVGLFCSISVIVYWILIRPQKRLYDIFRSQGIPCEPFVPLIGQLPDILRETRKDGAINYRMELIRKHGYIYVIGFGPLVNLVVMEPDILADAFGRSHTQDYSKPLNTDRAFKPLIGVHNLLVSEGVEHERARKMLNPAFHFIKLQSMISIMISQTRKAIEELVALPNDRQIIDLRVEFSTLTLAIIVSSAFGKNFDAMTDAKQFICRTFAELVDAVQYRTMRMIDFIPIISRLPFWKKNIIDQRAKELSDFADEIILDRRQNRSISLLPDEDMLDLLLSAVDHDGQPFNNQEIKDQALTFVLAGHETTGSLMTWIMYVLMTNEHVLQACRDEVDRVLPHGIEPTFEHINQLVICEAIIQETLRLYPPAPLLSRRCTHEHVVGREGHHQIRIPTGAVILFNIQFLQRREQFWPRPLEFDYTRWLRDPVTGLKPKLAHPFCYLPFGAGPRNCIGQNFALLEAKIILAMLVQRCNFELEPGQKIIPDIRIALRPRYGLRAKVYKR